jgi:hypothetical protein
LRSGATKFGSELPLRVTFQFIGMRYTTTSSESWTRRTVIAIEFIPADGQPVVVTFS